MNGKLIIGICDDELVYQKRISEILKKLLVKRAEPFEIITFSSGEDALYYKGEINILILMGV